MLLSGLKDRGFVARRGIRPARCLDADIDEAFKHDGIGNTSAALKTEGFVACPGVVGDRSARLLLVIDVRQTLLALSSGKCDLPQDGPVAES